jgi:hypothetical protein
MSETTNLHLLKHDNISTNNNEFDIDNYLNGNWNKLDTFLGKLKETVVLEKTTAMGTTIDTTDALSSKKNSIDIFSRSTQATRKGKNFLNLNATKTIRGVTVTNNSDGTLTINGTSTGPADFFIANGNDANSNPHISIASGTKVTQRTNIISGAIPSGCILRTVWHDGTTLRWNDISGNCTFTFPTDGEIRPTGLYIPAGVTFDNVKIFPQLERGITATTPEQYGAMPSPGFSSEVSCITGNQDIYVSGNNKFDGILESGIINGFTGLNISNSSYVRSKNYIPVKELTNYKITSLNVSANVAVYEYKADFSYNLTTAKIVALSSHFQTNSDTKFIRFRPVVENSSTALRFQVEEGTTATTYKSFKGGTYTLPLGNIALRSIGDIKDRIYKNGTKWYSEQNIEEKNINGDASEPWTYYEGNADWARPYISVPGKILNEDDATNNAISNKFKPQCWNNRATMNEYGVFTYSGDRRINFFVKKSDLSSQDVAGVKSYFSSNNTKVYYRLETPVITEISDASLIQVLEQLQAVELSSGVNHITGEANLILTYRQDPAIVLGV